MQYLTDFFYSHLIADTASVAKGSDGKVYPVASVTAPFDDQLVELLTALVADVQQDGRIADGLLHANTSDIGRAPRQVVAVLGTTHSLIHFLTAERTVDDQRVVTLPVTVVPPPPQPLQPSAQSFQVLYLCLVRNVLYSPLTCLG